MIIRNKSKINHILFCLLFVILAGCGKPFYKPEKPNAIKYSNKTITTKANKLQLEIEKLEDELLRNRMIIERKAFIEKTIKEKDVISKVFKYKLDEITSWINVFTARERGGRRGETYDEYLDENYRMKAKNIKVIAKYIENSYDISINLINIFRRELDIIINNINIYQDNENNYTEKKYLLEIQLELIQKGLLREADEKKQEYDNKYKSTPEIIKLCKEIKSIDKELSDLINESNMLLEKTELIEDKIIVSESIRITLWGILDGIMMLNKLLNDKPESSQKEQIEENLKTAEAAAVQVEDEYYKFFNQYESTIKEYINIVSDIDIIFEKEKIVLEKLKSSKKVLIELEINK